MLLFFSKENFYFEGYSLSAAGFLFCFQNESYPLATVDFFFFKMFVIRIIALRLKPPFVDVFIF